MKKVTGTTNWLMKGKKARVLITFEDGEKVLLYKGYVGSVKVDKDDWHYGKLLNYRGEAIRDLVMYEGETLKALEKDFKKAVREYMCIMKRKERKQK